MRRSVLHISVASIAFVVGFFTAGDVGELLIALPLALVVFVLVDRLPRLRLRFKLPENFDPHWTLVTVITTLLTIPVVFIFLSLNPQNGLNDDFYYCEIQSSMTTEKDSADPGNSKEQVATDTARDRNGPCDDSFSVKPRVVIYRGVLNRKAVSLPVPDYALLLKPASVKGVVVVSVDIDISGHVVWADAVSGHPFLRQAARDAACKARFQPSLLSGEPLWVHGILTYNYPR
jgi:hypothetical protein